MSFGWIVVAHILARMIVRPLKALEEEMRQIAEGKLEKVAINSKDREIVSLTNAFNKMLKELELRQKHLIQTEKLASLGTLVSGVAHELNNPLSNISSSCQILMEEFEDADMEYKKQLLSQIDEQTERARNIVHSLLEFSRHKEFKKETLPLKRLFEETILFVKGEIPAGAKINLDIQEDVFVLADKQRIQQVFLNLIKNALQSIADEGSLFIRARKHIFNWKTEEKEICEYPRFRGKCTGKCPDEKDTIDIEIEDTGSGMPPEVLPKIFDPFFTTKDVGKGSGLGLFIVQEIIEEHDGCIGVDSEIGKGTCFLIRLPIRSDDAKKRETINR
jgi:two-component system NtrC family sensor kinase